MTKSKKNDQTEISYEKINNQFANLASLFDLLVELPDVTECKILSGGVAAVYASFMALWEHFDEADKTDDSDGPDSAYSKLMNEGSDVYSLISMLFFNPRMKDKDVLNSAVFAIQNQFKRIWDDMGYAFPYQPEDWLDDEEEAMAA